MNVTSVVGLEPISCGHVAVRIFVPNDRIISAAQAPASVVLKLISACKPRRAQNAGFGRANAGFGRASVGHAGFALSYRIKQLLHQSGKFACAAWKRC